MNNHRLSNRFGFTLAELMIVIAIVGVLVAVSIPIFSAQMEKSKQATDIANMRSAKAAAIADWLNKGSPQPYTRYYDAAKGIMTNEIPVGYGKSGKDSAGFAAYLNATGIPNAGTPRYVVVNIDDLGLASLTWGGNASYMNAVSPYSNKSLVELKSMPNADRIKADQEVLKAIAKEILKQGWTKNDLETNLSIYYNGGYRIADYYQDKTSAVEHHWDDYEATYITITCKPYFQEILKMIGYSGNTIGDSTDPLRFNKDSDKKLSPGAKDIKYDNSLFYSDELATNKYKEYTIDDRRRIIYLSGVKTDSSGIITQFTINAKAHGEADMDEHDKKPFIITVSATS